MYADMGHFGRWPVTCAWLFFAYPCLVLQYFGQGAFFLSNPESRADLFYRSIPEKLFWFMFIFSIFATVIASQATLTGSFTVLSQAVNLGYFPRLKIVHTDPEIHGRVYLPDANLALAVATIAVAVGFRSSEALATAYGTTVNLIMTLTTFLLILMVYYVWRWNIIVTTIFGVCLLTIDISLAASSLFKIGSGGWLPLLFGIILALMMNTFSWGSRQLRAKNNLFVSDFLDLDPAKPLTFSAQVSAFNRIMAEENSTQHTHSNALSVFLTDSIHTLPFAMVQLMNRARFVPERALLLNVLFVEVPVIKETERIVFFTFDSAAESPWLTRACVRIGFAESRLLDIHSQVLNRVLRLLHMPADVSITYFLSQMSIRIDKSHRYSHRVVLNLYAFLRNNARHASKHFSLPPNQVLEIGSEITL